MSCALLDVHKSKIDVVVLLHSINIGRTYFYSIFFHKIRQCLLRITKIKIKNLRTNARQALHPNNFHNYALIRDF
jgi:hypothetical protein